MGSGITLKEFFRTLGAALEKTGEGLGGLNLRVGEPAVGDITRDEMCDNIPDRGVIATVPFTSPAAGVCIIFFPIPFGAAIPEKIINPGAQGAPEQFSEIHRSALGELISQAWHSAAAELSSRTGLAFRVSEPEIQLDTIGNYLNNFPGMLGIRRFYASGYPSRIDGYDFTFLVAAPDEFIAALFPENGKPKAAKVKLAPASAEKKMTALEAPVVEKKNAPTPVKKAQPRPSAGNLPDGVKRNLNVLLDIPVEVTIEIGRAKIPVDKLMNLTPGTVVGLDNEHGQPARVYVNEQLVALGHIVTIGEKFGVNIVELVEPKKRLETI